MLERLVEKHDTKVNRALEIIPGLLTWSVILLPVWLGLLYPAGVIYFLTLLTVYWAYLALRNTIGLMLGYPKYKRELSTNWMEKINELDYKSLPDKPTLPPIIKDVKHMVLIPVVNEPEEVLRPSIESILNQTYPIGRVTVVYTIEEKYAEQTKKTIQKILKGREKLFDNFLFFVHPAGIPGEAIGAGAANRTWGARHATKFLKENGYTIRNFIFSTIDADHVLHQQYLARLTHLYLTSDRRDYKFYATAVHLFDNNLWKVPSMMRIEANFVTLGTLASRSLPWGLSTRTKDTFAAYSTSLQTLIDADYWDVSLGVDDTIFYWRAFFVRNGEFELASHYIPYSADAVEAETFWKSHVSLYKQLLRWGWGVIEVPFSVKRFLTNKAIPFGKKILWIYDHIKTRVLAINMVFLITFGFGIATLINPNIKQSSFAYSLPDVMSVILTGSLVFLFPISYYKTKISKPAPKSWPLWKKNLVFLESFLIIINLLTFSFIPFIEAQTRMMLGKRMKDLYHTPKIRKS